LCFKYSIRFIRNAVQFLSEYGFDGLDVDWEFPGKEGPASQKDQLTDFLAEFRSYTTQPVDSESSKFILTAAVPATKYIVDIGFDIPGIAR
jgi:chitinase